MHHVDANGANIPAIGLGTWTLTGKAATRLVPSCSIQSVSRWSRGECGIERPVAEYRASARAIGQAPERAACPQRKRAAPVGAALDAFARGAA